MITSYIDSALTEACRDYDLTMAKVKVFMEAAARQLEINYTEAELKVMQESGTDDDLAYLYEEANTEHVNGILAAIQKIIEAIAKFFSDLRDKIVEKISTKENKDALDKIEKKLKLFPLLAKKKIIVENYDEEAKVAESHMTMLQKLKAKFSAGQEVTVEDVSNVEKSFMEKHGKVIGVATAATITVVAAVAIAKNMVGDYSKVTQKIQKGFDDFADSVKTVIKSSKTEIPAAGQKLISTASTIAKTQAQDFSRVLSNLVTQIKKGVGSLKNHPLSGKKVADMLTAEGTEDSVSTEELEKEMETAATENDGATSEESEFDDPIDIEPEDAVDPWDEVLADIAIDDDSEKLPVEDETECGEGCKSQEKCCKEDATFEEAFKSYFEETNADESDAQGDLPQDENATDTSNETTNSNNKVEESSIKDLFNQIYNEVTGNTENGKVVEEQALSETAQSLLRDIEDLF